MTEARFGSFLRRMAAGAFNSLGYEIRRLRNQQQGFVPYVEFYRLTYRDCTQPCDFRFWISNRAAEQWYKEWFHQADNPTWELDELSWLIEPGDHVLEIGCHHGFLTLMLAHRVGSEGRVLALDANPENTMITQAQIALNGLRNCEAKNLAAGDSSGSAKFAWRTNSHKLETIDNHSAYFEVPMVTCDELDRQFGPFNVLKIDVEGFEAAVLRGSRMLLTRRPKLLLELHPKFMDEYGYGDSIEDVFELIGAQGYEGTMVIRPDFGRSLPFDAANISKDEVTNVHLRSRREERRTAREASATTGLRIPR